MFLEKKEFKELYNPYILSKNKVEKVIHCSGYNGLDVNTSVNVSFTDIGIFIDKVMGNKYFIKIETITNVDVNANVVYVDTEYSEALHLEFIFGKKDFKTTNTAFYFLREQLGKPVPDAFKPNINLPLAKDIMRIETIEHREQLMMSGEVYCPKCLSTQLATSPAKPSLLNNFAHVVVTCLNCGNSFYPGKK